MNFDKLTIDEAQESLKKKSFSCTDLVSACLTKIVKLNPKLNAFLTVCEKESLKEAQRVDKLIYTSRNTKELYQEKPLLGVPLGVKDNFCAKDVRTTAGSKVLENYFPPYDSTVVARLKAAGAIIIGKTNLDAWAHGSSGENSDFGATKNPWNLDYVPGGSSSGSAAAVGADMAMAATGTDTAGSIRLPASFCNLVGLKPTYGRVSRYGVIAMGSSLDSIGHLTKNVIDSAIILSVTAGKDPQDATTSAKKVPDYLSNLKKSIKGIKIGLPKEYFIQGCHKGVEKQVKKALTNLEKLGANIVDISLSYSEYALAAYYVIMPSEVSSNLARFDGIRYGVGRDKFGSEAKRRIMLGTYTLSAGYYEAYYLKAMKVRTLIRKDFDKAFEKVDVICAPVSPVPPFKIGEKKDDPLQMYLVDIYNCPANLAGIPSLALPAGFVEKMPVGVQILGPQFKEDLLLQIGYSYEQATNWREFKPEC